MRGAGEAPSDWARAWPVPAGFVPPKGELPPISSTPASLKLGEMAGAEETGQTEIRIRRKGKRNQWKCYHGERRSVIL